MKVKQFVELLGVALLLTSLVACGPSGPVEKEAPAGGLKISGAGATFPNPLYQKWIEEYEKENTNVAVQYDSVGSGYRCEAVRRG